MPLRSDRAEVSVGLSSRISATRDPSPSDRCEMSHRLSSLLTRHVGSATLASPV